MWSKDDIFYIHSDCRGIGDHVQFTRLPELFFRDFGQKFKLLVNDKYKIWEKNPYVDLTSILGLDNPGPYTIDLWRFPYKTIGNPVFRMSSHFTNDVPKTIKPSFYQEYSTTQNYKNVVTICITGIASQMPLHVSEYVVSKLLEQGKTIVQIGGSDNKLLSGCVDKRMFSIIETAHIIAQSNHFIGINSGFMHVANSTPVKNIWIFMDHPCERPVENVDRKKYPGDEWLYDDNMWFSDQKNLKNVESVESMLKKIGEIN